MEFFCGSVTVRLQGGISAAKITQIAQTIPLTNVRRDGTFLTMQLPLSDVKKLRHLLKGQRVRMRIIKRRGLPFVRVWLRKGAPFWAATMAALLLLLALSGTVLEVRVTGTQNAVLTQQLEKQMEEMGVRRGMLIRDVNKELIETAVQESHPDLTYVSVKKQGSRLELFVVEATDAPEVFDIGEPVDIVAGSAGLITNVTVFSGMPLVQPGDTVRQGQVLIQGIDDEGNPCHASGEITARLWHRGVGESQLYEEVREKTGRKVTDTLLYLGEWQIPWFKQKNPFANYDISHQQGSLLDGLFFPITWDKITVYEVNVTARERALEEVSRQAAQRALTDALNLIPNGARVVDKRLEYSKISNEKLLATLILETQAQIGVQTKGMGAVWEE